MDPSLPHKVNSNVDKDSLIQRLVSRAPKEYVRPPDAIPFHIPHSRVFRTKPSRRRDTFAPVPGLQQRELAATVPSLAKVARFEEDSAKKTEEKEAEQKIAKASVQRKLQIQDEPTDLSKRKTVHRYITAKWERKRTVDEVKRLRKKIGIEDHMSILERVRTDKSLGFLYMVYAVPKSSELYTPYALKVVPYEEIDKTNYVTVSYHGVTQWRSTEMIFTPLDIWDREYQYYCKLIQIKCFALFRKWKGFYVWHKNVRWTRYSKSREDLAKSLFYLDPALCNALLEIQQMRVSVEDHFFPHIFVDESVSLSDFLEAQTEKITDWKKKLTEFWEIMRSLVYDACNGSLINAGFTVDDKVRDSIIKEYGGRPPKMAYTDQANKRRHCFRLSSFVRLADYKMQRTLHKLMINSMKALYDICKIHFKYLPPSELLSSEETDTLMERCRDEGDSSVPFFITEVLVNKHAITFDPSESDVLGTMTYIFDSWDSMVTDVQPFLPDNMFKPFTEPLIGGKIEERTCGEAPNLEFVLREDEHFQHLKSSVLSFMKQTFQACHQYIQRFQFIREFYVEDLLRDLDQLKQETILQVFRELLENLEMQMTEIEKVVRVQALGLILLDFGTFKDTVLPAPLKIREVLDVTMPTIGRNKIQALVSEANESQSTLEVAPLLTDEYVDYLQFLEGIIARIDYMESETDYVKELYDISDEFSVPVPADDMSNYLSFGVTVSGLRSIAENKISQKEKFLSQLVELIDKDINDLTQFVGDLRVEAVQPMLLDAQSKREDVDAVLADLRTKLEEGIEKANVIKSCQKQFKMEITKFELIDEVGTEVRLRELLWESMDTWDTLVEEWLHVDFHTLDPEDLNTHTMKHVKYVHQLEKGLPENELVPRLKDKVDRMKEKLPFITNLRNPAMKPRHWAKVEEVLDYKFEADQVVTLQLFEDIGALTFTSELQELSGQASSEAGLEVLLKKVEDSWKTLEFIALPHKDYKDVYILAGTDEIQVVVEESYINISTIASSRHVGPIKPRVDEWAYKLDLFQKTLDEWLDVQRNWLYLESIFSAPDIQRQLPIEAKLFLQVDKTYKDIMRNVHKMPLAMQACTEEDLLGQFKGCNENLEQILKCLERYLESKRVVFPRFYFLSNDELISILAQTRNPHAVQVHLRKCFDAIDRLEFATAGADESRRGSAVQLTTDIVAMLSPEGERVLLGKGLKARGNVEEWLGKVEEAMFVSLKRLMKIALMEYDTSSREDWVLKQPSQIVATDSQIVWCRDIHTIFDAEGDVVSGIAQFEQKSFADLAKLANVVRGKLTKLNRKVLCALITIDVHARDIVTGLVAKKVESSTSFEWLKVLRYYWEKDVDDCVARMSSAYYRYGYEYLGATDRLVITPLTDRCFLCLMGALQLDLGGAPAGPAGTGKTESTKDLAKSLAIQCVVFNCSEGLDYKMMGRFFSGLAQSGAWCCFDEFNRIDIEVLSVIAQQLITIRNAKAAKLSMFMFEGREIKLIPQCAAFITMNPGYAGRTELPDNLKALFRPISMMVPDYTLIAEVILYSEGFKSSKILGQKMTLMYKLCSEQLSQQDHYDFGMRAVKSVLVMAGGLMRANPDKSEDAVLIRALRDSNLPKFLTDDAILFQGILCDLFPGVEIPEQDYGLFKQAVIDVLTKKNLQPEDCILLKVIQLHETMIVRHGVMLVGPTGGGKTTIYEALQDALTKLYHDKVLDPLYRPVTTYVLNPKSVTIGELYGEVNPLTLEWRDGLLAICVRTAVQVQEEEHQWVICDGPVDAVWIENMNTVLDDNKMLCLANSERIKFTPWIHMVFEVADLQQASPATVSRCGMVYVDPEDLKWLPYVQTWLARTTLHMDDFIKSYIEGLFLHNDSVENGLLYTKRKTDAPINQVDISKVTMLCKLMESILSAPGMIDSVAEKIRVKNIVCQTFVFSYLWSIGGNILELYRDGFEIFVRSQFEEHPDGRLPPTPELWGLYMDPQKKKLETWDKIFPTFNYNKATPFFEVLVPTIDTVRYGFIMEKLLNVDKHVIFTGYTGVGKSVIARSQLNILTSKGNFVPIFINFSAQTSSLQTQEQLEAKLEKKKKGALGAPVGKKVIVFVDDVNMPKLDRYGAQPPIELLRQYLDFHGLYDRDKLFWKEILDVIIVTACGPPGGGRNPLTARFVRHFGMLFIPEPTDITMKNIFKSIVKGFLSEFTTAVSDNAEYIVTAAIEIYQRISADLLPTPTKSHYVFNLRDLSKCIQGVLQADAGVVRENVHILKLFCHETLRVFHDRLVNAEDKQYFYNLLREIQHKNFGMQVIQLPEEGEPPPLPVIYGDFMKFGADKADRVYDEIKDMTKLKAILQDYLDDYNMSTSKELKIVFFMDAIEHSARLARILRSERGNALLVGIGGTGKQSLTKMSSHMCGYKCFQIELTRGYDYSSFHEDLRKLYYSAGVLNEDTVFLFTDTQIVIEEFLEDINNILNSGEVPGLFESEEYERVIIGTRPSAKAVGIPEGNRDSIYEFFISRVRSKLHIVMCMSPSGDSFRARCRMFPSLVNCCTIDWFTEWPDEALLSVSQSFMVIMENPELSDKLARMCVIIHSSVNQMTFRYYAEMRRYYYTTPSSYLEILNLFMDMLKDQTTRISSARDKVKNGLQKLLETNDLVDTMQVELTALGPVLKEKSKATDELMKSLVVDQANADKVRQVVLADEAVAKQKAEETQAIAADAERDLSEALPILEEAVKALGSLDKKDIQEVAAFIKPPEMVKYVMEAVCILLKEKIEWNTAKSLLAQTDFLSRLYNYKKDEIPDAIIKKITPYIQNPKFVPVEIAKVSKACKSICMWVRAMDRYAKISRVVQPKRERFLAAEKELKKVMDDLHTKQQHLARVEEQMAALQAAYDGSVAEKMELLNKMSLTAARLERAGKLTSALGDEQGRWAQSVKNFGVELVNVVGNALAASGCVAYLGAFTSNYRVELVEMWIEKCNELKIPISQNFSMINVLADPYEIRQWNSFGLPRDNISTENGILATRARRWPLMIDPQDQANRWVRQMEHDNGLKVIKLTDSNFLRILESCVRTGIPVLLEEIGETLDPTLEPILLKQTFVQGGRLLIRLGDSDVEYDKNFKFYMTTKMSNPHYLPEICIKVTIINFTVTKLGLEDQLLSDVVRLERPDLEKTRNELIVKINEDKKQLKGIEDKILRLLFTSQGNILDDEELIETLNESKETSAVIGHRLKESEATEEKISFAREKYRTVATRGSVLFFVVAQLAEIDPMYQYSLKYFTQIFNMVIDISEKSKDLDVRLDTLLREITLSIYTNVSRGLFERHKLVFSFMLGVDIFKQSGDISEPQWNFLLRGPTASSIQDVPQKPDIATLSDAMWATLYSLSVTFPTFKMIRSEIKSKIPLNIGDYKVVIDLLLEDDSPETTEWDENLTDFEKMMLLKALKEEKLVFATTEYVKKNLGKKFVESPPVSLQMLYQDTSKITPLIFVLTTGSDPMGAFQRFAREKGFEDNIRAISLGQGQGPIAEKLINEAVKQGEWVFLQNCHLATSWMTAMERKVKDISENSGAVNDAFRLYLSSMPTKAFPVSVLQNSVKVTNEPPKGLKANVKRAFTELTEEPFETHALETSWRKIVFGICFFHAVIQERKKFGPLGWNISYEFNDSDRECALMNLNMFCAEGTIPWDALEYITGEITYGGRVTDGWDQRCLTTVLKIFFSPKTLEEGYLYSDSGIYYPPDYPTLQEFRDYIENFPLIDEPEIFGMHENANIAFQYKETQAVLGTIMDIQPRESGGEAGKSSDEVVYELAESIMQRLAKKINVEAGSPKVLRRATIGNQFQSLTIVLLQEIDRYNKLLKVLHASLENLQKAIKGFVVMSEQLEQVFKAFMNNQVPELWSRKAYPSLKTLGSWIRDLEVRLDFVTTWLMKGNPTSYWISGFFFPQGFLTGVLQTHARRFKIPIDQFRFDFIPKPLILDQEQIEHIHKTEFREGRDVYANLREPEHGVLIHGLFLDAGRWDFKKMQLVDPNPGEMNPQLPVFHFNPSQEKISTEGRYEAPLYKTSVRAGVLSTTGHSTNFVVAVYLPTDKPKDYWILKATALLTQLTN